MVTYGLATHVMFTWYSSFYCQSTTKLLQSVSPAPDNCVRWRKTANETRLHTRSCPIQRMMIWIQLETQISVHIP